MSNNSYLNDCPKCNNKKMYCYTTSKPYDTACGECLECGFSYRVEEENLDLDFVNELRSDRELKPLKKLQKQNK